MTPFLIRLACESYHLPEHLTPHVDFVTPTVHFDAKLSKRSSSGQPLRTVGLPNSGNGPKTTGQLLELADLGSELEKCDSQITPACLRALYNFNYVPVATEKNSYGIGECVDVVERTSSDMACSRVYPAIVRSVRSRYVRQTVLPGSCWCPSCHSVY